MKKVLRYRVPIDEKPHKIGAGKVLMAQKALLLDPGRPPELDVWVEVYIPAHWPQNPEQRILVKTVSTDQPISETNEHLYSCLVDREVIHIFQWV